MFTNLFGKKSLNLFNFQIFFNFSNKNVRIQRVGNKLITLTTNFANKYLLYMG